MQQHQFLKWIPGPGCNIGPGPGLGGPWALWPQYLCGNSEQLGIILNAFYAECRGISEGICSSITLGVAGRARFAKWHLENMKVVGSIVALKLVSTDTHTQDIEEAHV